MSEFIMEQSQHTSNSESCAGFPLNKLLHIYVTSMEGTSRSLYLDYMKQFKLIKDWLAPIGIPVVEQRQVHWFEGTYATAQLAIICGCSEITILETLKGIYEHRDSRYTR